MKQRRYLVVLAAGLVLAGACGDSAETITTTTLPRSATGAVTTIVEAAAMQPAITAADAIAATDLPIQYGPALLVAGREDCDLDYPVHATWTTDEDGTVLVRDGWFECAVTNIDSRITGTAHYTLNMDQWVTSDEHLAQAMWGTIRIENDGGAWEADYVGVFTIALGDVFTALFTGSGDYEGLSYYQWAVETHGNSWPTKGLIFPAESAIP